MGSGPCGVSGTVKLCRQGLADVCELLAGSSAKRWSKAHTEARWRSFTTWTQEAGRVLVF